MTTVKNSALPVLAVDSYTGYRILAFGVTVNLRGIAMFWCLVDESSPSMPASYNLYAFEDDSYTRYGCEEDGMAGARCLVITGGEYAGYRLQGHAGDSKHMTLSGPGTTVEIERLPWNAVDVTFYDLMMTVKEPMTELSYGLFDELLLAIDKLMLSRGDLDERLQLNRLLDLAQTAPRLPLDTPRALPAWYLTLLRQLLPVRINITDGNWHRCTVDELATTLQAMIVGLRRYQRPFIGHHTG